MMTVSAENQFLTVAGAAQYSGLTESSIRNHVARGTLPIKKFGKRILIERALLDDLIRLSAFPASETG